MDDGSGSGAPLVRLSAAERAALRRKEAVEAKARKEYEMAAAKAAEMALKESQAKRELEEKRRARTLLGLQGYWRPSSVFNSDAR